MRSDTKKQVASVCARIGGHPSSTTWKNENRPKLMGRGLPLLQYTHLFLKIVLAMGVLGLVLLEAMFGFG